MCVGEKGCGVGLDIPGAVKGVALELKGGREVVSVEEGKVEGLGKLQRRRGLDMGRGTSVMLDVDRL